MIVRFLTCIFIHQVMHGLNEQNVGRTPYPFLVYPYRNIET